MIVHFSSRYKVVKHEEFKVHLDRLTQRRQVMRIVFTFYAVPLCAFAAWREILKIKVMCEALLCSWFFNMKGMMAGRGCCEAPLKKSNHHNAVIFAFFIARKAELIAARCCISRKGNAKG